ncbi:unnamed protein product, partial [marine sediment metagenome]
ILTSQNEPRDDAPVSRGCKPFYRQEFYVAVLPFV